MRFTALLSGKLFLKELLGLPLTDSRKLTVLEVQSLSKMLLKNFKKHWTISQQHILSE